MPTASENEWFQGEVLLGPPPLEIDFVELDKIKSFVVNKILFLYHLGIQIYKTL